MQSPPAKAMEGNERFRSDKRRIAGVWLAISISVLIFPYARLAPHINRNGETSSQGLDLAFLISNLIILLLGIMGCTLSFMALVYDSVHPIMVVTALIVGQLAWIPYLTDMIVIGTKAASGSAFVPPDYGATPADVAFIGACGILGAGTVCFFLFGSLALLAFAYYAYMTGDAHSRTGHYWRQRLVIYSGVLVIAGLAQLMLGSYILAQFGSGPLPQPIGVAMFMVHFPEISVFVGLIWMLNGCYGMYRGCVQGHPHDQSFQLSMWFQWLCTLLMMDLTQIAYAPGSNMAEAGPTIAALTLGVHVTPAFLDYMGRTVPDEFTPEYYEMREGGTPEPTNKYVVSMPEMAVVIDA